MVAILKLCVHELSPLAVTAPSVPNAESNNNPNEMSLISVLNTKDTARTAQGRFTSEIPAIRKKIFTIFF